MTGYWFKPKRYGYGATPATWQGWVATFGCAIVLAGSIIAMNLLADRSNIVAWMLWAVLIAAATWWFVQFSRRRTDGEWRWRGGDRSDATNV
ncbi:MAG TPA: hypothetical protein VFX37_05720 [Pseudolabrys sp.]|nr:hypothetical protein [Pseudolabrys sp.]